jgi:hypothetical protein
MYILLSAYAVVAIALPACEVLDALIAFAHPILMWALMYTHLIAH